MEKKENYGFVYVWFDLKHRRYYVGSHWGHEDDGYVCSSGWMNSAYKRRPLDFKRRVVARVYTARADLLDEEHRWLSMIEPHELKTRYYNLQNRYFGHWTTNPVASLSIREKMSRAKIGKKRKPVSDETRKKLSEAGRGRQVSQEARENMSKAAKKRVEQGSHSFCDPEWYKKRSEKIRDEHK